MKTKFLLPNRFKYVGWAIALPALILMVLSLHYEFAFQFLHYQSPKGGQFMSDNDFLWNIHDENFTNEIGSLILISGLLMIAFSREKDEDERIAKLRLESLLWAVLVNSILIMLSIVFIYGVDFLNVMVYNICTPLILFIARFNLLRYFERKEINKENL